MDENDTTRLDGAGIPEPPAPPEPPVAPDAQVPPPPPPAAGYEPAAQAPQYPPPQAAYYSGASAPAPAPQGAPGIGVAGFVCVLVGLFVPFVGIIGLILSIVGYNKAKRENRPHGLALAGMIIGIVATVLGIILFIAFFATGDLTTTGGITAL